MKLNLTKSETKVVELKAKGFFEKQICDKLYVTIHTVKQHTKNALKRNQLSNGFELVARYAAAHPKLFKTPIIVIMIAISAFVTAPKRSALRVANVARTYKRSKRNRAMSKNKIYIVNSIQIAA